MWRDDLKRVLRLCQELRHYGGDDDQQGVKRLLKHRFDERKRPVEAGGGGAGSRLDTNASQYVCAAIFVTAVAGPSGDP
jgi:hypothetical protein